jgi:hypothetical protein
MAMAMTTVMAMAMAITTTITMAMSIMVAITMPITMTMTWSYFVSKCGLSPVNGYLRRKLGRDAECTYVFQIHGHGRRSVYNQKAAQVNKRQENTRQAKTR